MRHWTASIAIAGMLLLAIAGLWILGMSPPEKRSATPPTSGEFASPHAIAANDPANSSAARMRTATEAGYASDTECDECHAEIAAAYRRHPMGRSLATVAAAEPIERLTRDARNPFEHDGFRYEVEHPAGDAGETRLIHHETRITAEGRPVVAAMHEVQYAVGSGRRGRSYLLERDGSLWMSPITWYPQKSIWDLSPGYEINNSHFARPIQSNCLFCHCDRARPIEHSLNRYAAPVFERQAIGCQRCHGPGQRHVTRHRGGVSDEQVRSHENVTDANDTGDDSMVHPGRLDFALRDAICEQCHLSGDIRVQRRRQHEFDFRPGRPLSDVLAVFVKPQGTGDQRFVGHVEQMRVSRCYSASNGRLGCVTCHDPHRLPAADDRIAFYNGRCQKCHAADTCTGNTTIRATTAPPDNCVACHMPPTGSEVQHAATTDHRIPRSAGRHASPPVAPRALPIVSFYPLADNGDMPEDRRDLAVAIMMLTSIAPELIAPPHVSQARIWLEQAVEQHPDDLAAWEALGHARWQQGETMAARDAFARVLLIAPDREFALSSFAALAQAGGRHDEAIRLLERARRLNPHHLKYHLDAALSYAHLGQWRKCESAARRGLALQPANPGARQLLVESLLGLSRAAEAEAEFARLLAIRPQSESGLRRWFDQHPLRSKSAP